MSDREFSDITDDVDALLADPKHASAFVSARAVGAVTHSTASSRVAA